MGNRSSRQTSNTNQPKPKPKPLPRHKVSIGNWTNHIKHRRKKYSDNAPRMWFLVGRHGGINYDPARGCRKSFQSNYRCANGPIKKKNVAGEARGRWVLFNCRTENNRCNSYRLILTNEGNIQLRYGSRVIWQSNTNKVGLERQEYSAKNGKYGRNYIKSGEYLEEGEFIGSQTGNCYIIMTRDGLDLCYETSVCKVNKELIGYGDTKDSYTLYEISKEDPDNIEKTGYVSYDGTLTEHTESFTTLEGLENASTYLDIGNYNTTDNNLTINKFDGLSNADCKVKCDENNYCGAYFFSNKYGGCELKKHHIKEQRYRSEVQDGLLYIKAESPQENIKINSQITGTSGVVWDKYNIDTDNASDINKFTELGSITQDENKDLLNAEKKLENNNIEIIEDIEKLLIEDGAISLDTKENIKKFKENLLKYKTLDNKSKETKTKIYNLNAMKMDSESQLINENKEYLLWTIATIFVIITSMKIIKQK